MAMLTGGFGAIRGAAKTGLSWGIRHPRMAAGILGAGALGLAALAPGGSIGGGLMGAGIGAGAAYGGKMGAAVLLRTRLGGYGGVQGSIQWMARKGLLPGSAGAKKFAAIGAASGALIGATMSSNRGYNRFPGF